MNKYIGRLGKLEARHGLVSVSRLDAQDLMEARRIRGLTEEELDAEIAAVERALKKDD